jgi:hypothetical protein
MTRKGEVLTQGEPLEVLFQKQATQMGVVPKTDAEHIKHLSFPPVGAGKKGGEGWEGASLFHRDFQPHPLVVVQAEKMIHHVKTGGTFFKIIHPTDVHELHKKKIGVALQNVKNGQKVRSGKAQRTLPPPHLCRNRGSRKVLVEGGKTVKKRHLSSSPPGPVAEAALFSITQKGDVFYY